MDVRLAVAFFLQDDPGVTVTAFCAEHGIDRSTFYKLRRRFRAEGLEGLLPRSRRPRRSPTATPGEVIAAVVAMRQELLCDGFDHGARSIRYRMLRTGAAPSARTIHRILVAHGLVEPQPRKRPRSSYRSFQMGRANECWQMDGHQLKLADGTPYTVLRILDDCSRQVMASRAAWTENTEDIWACIQTACARHGAPAMFLSDNGAAFSQRRTRGLLGVLEARLRAAGIQPITAHIKHPQTCGKKEREWQTLDRWLAARPDPESLPDAQRLLDAYDWLYNHDRPHQSLDGQTPAQAWQHAEKATAAEGPLAGPMLTSHANVRSNGIIDLGGRKQMSIGTAWAGATVTILREDPACAILHHDQLIDFIHIDPTRDYQRRKRS